MVAFNFVGFTILAASSGFILWILVNLLVYKTVYLFEYSPLVIWSEIVLTSLYVLFGVVGTGYYLREIINRRRVGDQELAKIWPTGLKPEDW